MQLQIFIVATIWHLLSQTMFCLYHLDINGHKLTDIGSLAILRRCNYLKLSESLKTRYVYHINVLQLPIHFNYEVMY